MSNLVKITRKIASEYNIQDCSLDLLRESSDNKVYTITSGFLDKNLILRISKRNLGSDVLFELIWIDKLNKKGVPVVPVVKTKKGKLFFPIDKKSIGVIFKFISGSHLTFNSKNKPDLQLVKKAAQALGLLHLKASKLDINLPRKRTIFTELERALDKKIIFETSFKNGEEFISKVEKYLKWGLSQKYKPVFIHNDFRVNNVMFKDDKIAAIIDFDWACMGPTIKDLAHSLVEWSYPDKAQKPWQDVFNAFLNSYDQASSGKYKRSKKFYKWIAFSCLSDAATYLIDLAEQEIFKKIPSSYMYQKFLYFHSRI